MKHRIEATERPRIPMITDPYRQVLEVHFQLVGYYSPELPQHTRQVIRVVPIDTPERFLLGLENLLEDVRKKHTRSRNVPADGNDPMEGKRYFLDDPDKYRQEIDTVSEKFFRIHAKLRRGFSKSDQSEEAQLVQEAKQFKPMDDIRINPDWSPAINHFSH